MSSRDFQTVHIQDSRLANLSEKVNYAVYSGASSVSHHIATANTTALNSLVWTVQIPSQTTVVDKRVLFSLKVVQKVMGVPKDGEYLVQAGSWGYAPFPLHQLISNQSVKINNTNITSDTANELACFLQLNSKANLSALNSMTPSHPDGAYALYSDAISNNVSAINNPLAGYEASSLDERFIPRGAYGYTTVGSQYLNGVVSGVQLAGDGAAIRTVYIEYTFTEPLMFLSPWQCSSTDSGGLYNIDNLTFQFNMDTSLNSRALRFNGSNIEAGQVTVATVGLSDAKLYFNFLSPPVSMVLPPVNISPYYTTSPSLITFNTNLTQKVDTPLVSNTVTLNSIPDFVMICARQPRASLTSFQSDFFYSMKQVNITFNNQTGVCASYSPQELYQISRRNNLSANYLEFSGEATKYDGLDTDTIPTCGAPVVLRFGVDIPLPPGLASGSAGNYSWQVNTTVRNQLITPGPVELYCLFVYSGVCVIERGTCATYNGLLNSNDVLDAVSTPAVSMSQIHRLVGAGWMDKLKSFGSKAFNVLKTLAPVALPLAKTYLAKSEDPRAKMASSILGAVGYGKGSARHHRLM